MKKILGITLSVAAAIALSACSDDSASAPEETTPASTDSLAPASSDAIVPESSAAVLLSSDAGTLISSSSEALPVSSAETQPAVPCVDGDPVEVVPDTNGFADIGDVFKSVRCDEKVVFVLRHGEREAYVTRESELTEDGVEQAQTVGQKLIGTEDFTYSHTDFVRTEQTCLNIAIGRGQQSFPHDTNDIYQASWYVKDSEKRTEYNNMEGNNTNGVLAEWIFLGNYADAFYDLAEKSEEMIATYLAKSYAEMPRFRVVCSHDEFIIPLVSYLTNNAINYRIYDVTIVPRPRWANYLSGAAIILNSAGERRAYAVKGLDSGFY